MEKLKDECLELLANRIAMAISAGDSNAHNSIVVGHRKMITALSGKRCTN